MKEKEGRRKEGKENKDKGRRERNAGKGIWERKVEKWEGKRMKEVYGEKEHGRSKESWRGI